MQQPLIVFVLSLTCIIPILPACGDDEGGDGDTRDAGEGAGEADRGGSGSGARNDGNSSRGGKDAGGDAAAAADDAEPLTIRFKATLGAQELACGREYPDQGSTDVTVTPQDFRFFVEEVKLIEQDGEAHELRFDEREPFQTQAVALLDFTDGAGQCKPGRPTVNTTITGRIEPGEYTSLELVIGVPEEINHQNIALAKAPLSDSSTHWGWQMGYRFLMAEVLPVGVVAEQPDPDADAGIAHGDNPHGGPGLASIVHIGSGGCEGSNAAGYTCSRPNRNRVRLEDFDPESDTIVADLSKVFEGVDLEARAECHGPDPACKPAYEALGVDIASGAALDSQSVFRVE